MPLRVRLRLDVILAVYLAVAYGVAWGAVDATRGPDLLALPWLQAVVGVGVAWIGGFAASLGRLVAATYDSKPFAHGREFARDGAVSVVIGLGGYWAGAYQEIHSAQLALYLLLGGYAGTRTLSTPLDKLLARPPAP